jgi:hypothetical protein
MQASTSGRNTPDRKSQDSQGTLQSSPQLPGSSSVLILMAKSEIRGIYVGQAIENLVCQPAGHRENDFAIRISFGECGMGLLSGAIRRVSRA